MRLGIYGGTFNPPHKGHVRAAVTASERLNLDVLFVVPAGLPPHKKLPVASPTGEERMEMARLSFSGVPHAEITDLELKKGGISYTAETVDYLSAQYPNAVLFLIVGSDMYLTLDKWKEADRFLRRVTPAVLLRGDRNDSKIRDYSDHLLKQFNTKTVFIENDVIDISSTTLRQKLAAREGTDFFENATYAYIIKNRLYGAKPDWDWLRARAFEMILPKRIPHVRGCETEAVKLARHWGVDENEAREAAIMHDITKYRELDDQLQLCARYDIMTDNVEKAEVKLLHAKTGAAVAFYEFGASQSVHDAIMWHTTGKADMKLLEKIIYMADYIEQTREFDGVEELRKLAYTDLDLAVIKGLTMSISEMKARGIVPHLRTEEAIKWLLDHNPQHRGD